MNGTCIQCAAFFDVTDEEIAFLKQISPAAATIPPSKRCPECRMQARMAWCNERVLHHNTCAKTGKPVISEIHPSSPIKVWNFRDWWTDAFSALDYGQDVDLNRSILDQLFEIKRNAPHPCVRTDSDNENSDYTHHAGHEKNCYLMFHTSFAEDCLYGYGVKKAESCVDNFYCHESQVCYECIDVKGCYDLQYSQDCINCSSSAFLRDCIGCQDCLLCVGLRNKKNCILNEQLSEEEFKKRKADLSFGHYSQVKMLKARFRDLQLQHPFECVHTEMVENSSGNNLYKAKDCQYCFDCSDIEGSAHCVQLQMGTKFCRDIYQFGINIELCYDCSMIGYQIYNCAFCYDLIQSCSNLFYCIGSSASKDCFACFGLRHHRYCILNKQYTEEEYNALVPKLIERMKLDGEWGEFLPMHQGESPYNESTAELWYPLSKQEAVARGLGWREDNESDNYLGPKVELPDNIADVDDSICEQILLCEASGKPYKIIPQELKFYREHNIPLPRRSFNQRHRDRFNKRNPRTFFERNCGKCGSAMQTTYSPERPEIVYCKECYRSALY